RQVLFGLGGVVGLIFLLALRTLRPAAEAPLGAPGAALPPGRSAIEDAGMAHEPAEGAAAQTAAERLAGGMPVNARTRSRSAIPDPAAEAPVSAPANSDTSTTGETTGSATDAHSAEAAANDTTPAAAAPVETEPTGEPLADGAAAAVDLGEAAALRSAIQNVEALVNREKAERGAQIAKLEAGMASRTGATTAAGDVGPALESRLNQFLTIAAFNDVMNQKVFKRVRELIDASIEERLKSAKTPGATGEGATSDMADELKAVRADMATLRQELEEVQSRLSESAGGDGQTASSLAAAVAGVKAAREADRAEIDGLAQSLAHIREVGVVGNDGGEGDLGEGEFRALAERTDKRVEEAIRSAEDVRSNFAAMTDHVERLGEEYRALAERVDTLSKAPSVAPEGAGGQDDQPSETPEVDALRDALTTIIEQNREIRAQQDALAAHLSPEASDTER
ncbi:MAG: hypothetical protein AAGF49_06065, partial [Pseudomonadota bacterium]